ncbi:hypothetical protein A2U01_0051759, partial [Trifolium medium]|nr:hypothetical protein [Trifolium medium]
MSPSNRFAALDCDLAESSNNSKLQISTSNLSKPENSHKETTDKNKNLQVLTDPVAVELNDDTVVTAANDKETNISIDKDTSSQGSFVDATQDYDKGSSSDNEAVATTPDR